MDFVSTPFYRAAKATYYGIFNVFAKTALRRTSTKRGIGRLDKRSIKLVSYYGWQNGISEGALLQLAAFRALGYDVDIVDITPAMSNPFARIESDKADLFIVHCGGTQFLRAAWPLRHVLKHGRVVAYFAWELPDPPRDWPRSRHLWDEIWTPSQYSARALAKWYDGPLKVVPHVLLRDDTQPRKWRKGEEPLVFLTMADARSSLSRKNPRGVIKAFQLAFPHETDVQLLVKLHKTEIRASNELRQLLGEIAGDPRIHLINETMTRDDLEQMILKAHTLISLHRAEGFGIPLLEAQTLGLATIATAWSGNLDFTTEGTSLLIPHTMTTTQDSGGVYGEVTWAEPSIEAAAAAMRKLYDDPLELSSLATAGWNSSRPKRQLERFTNSLKRTCLSE
jgi:glycosyltransferase involved in cell wall biosynthesis